MAQCVWRGEEGYSAFVATLKEKKIKRLFLVCDEALRFLPLDGFFTAMEALGITVTRFSDFQPNPHYESVAAGVERFRETGGELILAIGGGSAIDVAKCVKLYSGMDAGTCYLEQEVVPNRVELFAIPTTAGTGSEATRHAVIYYQGEKQSVTHPSCIPTGVLLDGKLLKTLPDYQKRSAMLDALCHGIESAWSLHSNGESKAYSLEAIRRITKWMAPYLEGDGQAAEEMLLAANLAGKAINITQTTAGHAMSYKLTSMYGLSHGHSAALCLPRLWRYMREHPDRCVDPRGGEHLARIFGELAEALGCPADRLPEDRLAQFLRELGLKAPENWHREDIPRLAASVNPTRLKNNPVALDGKALALLYEAILSEEVAEG